MDRNINQCCLQTFKNQKKNLKNCAYCSTLFSPSWTEVTRHSGSICSWHFCGSFSIHVIDLEYIGRHDLHGFRQRMVRSNNNRFIQMIFHSMSLTILIRKFLVKVISFNKKTEKEASNMMKLIAINVGIVVTIFAMFVEKFGSVFRMGISISGCLSDSFLSMFILGMTSRSANAKVINFILFFDLIKAKKWQSLNFRAY